MFGNAPKGMWEKWIPADERNRIPLACRCLLVRDAGRNVLLEAGIGAFFEPAMRERIGVVEDRHVLLESLAAVGVAPEQIDATGRLELVSGETSRVLGDGYRFHRSAGHTPGLLLAEVEMPDGPVVFCADLIPGKAWVHLPITMGYDRYPELLIDEKAALLGDLLARHGRLFFTHDPVVAMGTLVRDARGKFGIADEQTELRSLAV